MKILVSLALALLLTAVGCTPVPVENPDPAESPDSGGNGASVHSPDPTGASAAAEDTEAPEDPGEGVWMYVLSIGKADAILLHADGHTVLIDTGYDYSRGRILSGMAKMGVTALDAVFITHLDNDHTGGLTWLAESDLSVGAWYASAMYMGVKKKAGHPVTEAAALRGDSVVFLQAGDRVSLGSAVLKVLAPLEAAEDKENNNSLVMMLESQEGKILLTGDIEYPAESLLMKSGANLKCDVLKVANHADDDTNSPAFTQKASPSVAVISTSSAEKASTPDPTVVRLLQAQGASVYVTEACTGGILVRLKGGVPAVSLLDAPAPNTGVRLVSAVPGDDLITLLSDSDVDLSGWYLLSNRGNEMFIFPEDTVIRAGETLTVGTRSSPDGTWDLFWNEKKVVQPKKEDVFTLYDAAGNAVSSVSNGL